VILEPPRADDDQGETTIMSRFVLAGEPMFSGSTLYWGATLDPGTFEMVYAGSTKDLVDAFRMEADDPSGIDAHSTSFTQYEVPLPTDVMPGDSYQSRLSLDLPSGYYHLMLTLDEQGTNAYYRLNVRVESGSYELKSWSYA
jgi:hypothetical protein